MTEITTNCYGKMSNYINGMKLLQGGDFVAIPQIRMNYPGGVSEYLDKNPSVIFLREPVHRR
jgi:hypothetical protein